MKVDATVTIAGLEEHEEGLKVRTKEGVVILLTKEQIPSPQPQISSKWTVSIDSADAPKLDGQDPINVGAFTPVESGVVRAASSSPVPTREGRRRGRPKGSGKNKKKGEGK